MTLKVQGLGSEEARRRLQELGPNEMDPGRSRSVIAIVFETLKEPMFLLLIAAATIYAFMGDLGEGLFLLGGAGAAIGLVIFQEARSEQALRALRQLAQPQSRVLRDGADCRVPAREIVPGDIVLAGEGERLPVDGLLVAGDVLSVDESVLTGESAPVAKTPSQDASLADEGARPGSTATHHVFAGTLIVRGQAVIQATRTGAQSALGRIGSSLADIEHERTPLQQSTGKLIGYLGLVALAFCSLTAATYGLLLGDWPGGALAGITVAIALIPEEFPMVLAIFLALGAWRLATHKVLVRRSAVIETLGGATVLCADKTGTLTENRMQVARLWTQEGQQVIVPDGDMSAPVRELLQIAALASAVRPVDPMDRAVRALSGAAALTGAGMAPEPERAWPLTPSLLAVIQLWQMPDGARVAAAKGAPEAIFRLCRLPQDQAAHMMSIVESYAGLGLRVLGVASVHLKDRIFEDPLLGDFRFSGLIGFIDPLRAEVPQALQEARRAGIKVVMITGDHPTTAMAIAAAAGIDTAAGFMVGSEIEELPFEVLCEKLKTVRVFARIAPEQKLRIVQALRQDGEIVAMTGDGVNDAPALEAAHIGVAMGQRGTDVAREAADLILLNDSFASIVGAVRLGRRIFSNLRRAITYIIAIHIPIAGLALLPLLVGLPPLFFPMHIVLLELVIDPTCALVFEAEPSDRKAMQRPPRRSGELLFGRRELVFALLQGAGLLAAVFALYWSLLTVCGAAEPVARGAAFIALVVGNLVLALTDSAASGRIFAPHRRVFWAIVAGVAVVLVIVFTIDPVSAIFAVDLPGAGLLAIAVGIGLAGGGWTALRFLWPANTPERPEGIPK
ncbi:MAG: cation-translocating P-type ATPase [Alphaproteobacteria bacterium]|nr:cation-translocating P-type ATPase [Alphaproteobacteria bacterium]MBU4162517.1 cation-translocating P-type ATPase [Alphaproteobacteria bacterium]